MTARGHVIAICSRNRGNDAETCCTGECEQGRRCPLLARRVDPPVSSELGTQRMREDNAFRARILRHAVVAAGILWAILATLILIMCSEQA